MDFNMRSVFVLCIIAVSTLVGLGNSRSCQCDVQYKKIGCYHDPGSYRGKGHHRPLKDLLINWRHKINWTEGWNDQLREMTCKCAELANEKGYHYIGLQYYGECWSGVLDVKLFDGNKSEECWGYQPDYENCDDDSPTECIGTANHNYIYEVRPEAQGGCPPSTKTTTAATTTPTPTVDPCDPNPCMYGGECVKDQNHYKCYCPSDYWGDNCEKKKRRPFGKK